MFVEDILRGTPLAARAWKWYQLECYIEYASRKITSIVNSRYVHKISLCTVILHLFVLRNKIIIPR